MQNRTPIFAVLEPRLQDCRDVLEIGSGTGQHAVYFAADLPHLTWHTSDRPVQHAGIQAWLDEAGLANTPAPISLDVADGLWPQRRFDAVFSANTAHIMSTPEVAAMFAGVGRVLRAGGYFLLYGPFNYAGQFSSDSNVRFDSWLKQRDPASGIKDLDWLRKIALHADLTLGEDIEMPVNNRLLVWLKSPSVARD